jgi:hypothetical protein
MEYQMRFRILITMIASVGIAVSGLANAALITHNNYTLNPSTNIVTHTDGTEWLQWDETKGMSISGALRRYASEGWVLAGNTQMSELLSDFGFNVSIDENIETVFQSPETRTTDDEWIDHLQALFGVHKLWEGDDYDRGVGVNANAVTYVNYGSDLDGDLKYSRLIAETDFLIIADDRWGGPDYIYDIYGYAAVVQYDHGGPTADTVDPLFGVALVRVTSVPEPSTLAIFALGMIGLASRRFKKQS